MKKYSKHKINEAKSTISKEAFKKRVEEEAKEMQANLKKSENVIWTLAACKKEAERILRDEFIIEAGNPDEIRSEDIGRNTGEENIDQEGNSKRQAAAEKGAEGSVDKNEKIKTHVFRYVGSDGDGLVFSNKRDEEKMGSDNWQYLGEFPLPGAMVNQLPRNEDKDEWRVVHKNG